MGNVKLGDEEGGLLHCSPGLFEIVCDEKVKSCSLVLVSILFPTGLILSHWTFLPARTEKGCRFEAH